MIAIPARGIDCSHWNGMINWPKLADDGVKFAYIKATQGLNEDPMFQTNATGADQAGILTLAYPFVTAPDNETCVAKFNGVVGPTMPAILDCEATGIGFSIGVWLAGLGKRPTLAYIGIAPPFTPPRAIWNLPRVLPEYAPRPRLSAWDGVSPPDWSKSWLIWQSSDREQFAGETGNFDLDILAIDFERFKVWCQTGVFPPG